MASLPEQHSRDYVISNALEDAKQALHNAMVGGSKENLKEAATITETSSFPEDDMAAAFFAKQQQPPPSLPVHEWARIIRKQQQCSISNVKKNYVSVSEQELDALYQEFQQAIGQQIK